MACRTVAGRKHSGVFGGDSASTISAEYSALFPVYLASRAKRLSMTLYCRCLSWCFPQCTFNRVTVALQNITSTVTVNLERSPYHHGFIVKYMSSSLECAFSLW